MSYVERVTENSEGNDTTLLLKNTVLNLWDGIREDVLDYFDKHKITWWRGGKENTPTSLLHSSQVACLNHLYWLRVRKDAALEIFVCSA